MLAAAPRALQRWRPAEHVLTSPPPSPLRLTHRAQASSELLDACLANDPKEARGVGCDNMTAVVVLFGADKQPATGSA